MSSTTKFLLQTFCKYVYISGSGNFHYDQKIYKETFFYKMYSVVSYSIYITMILLENCAAIFGKFPEVEKNSAVMFAAIHNIVLAKMFLLLYHKNSIRKLNYEMGTVMEYIEKEYVMREQYRKVKFGILLYVASVYLSLVAYGVESLRKAITEGVPFYTVVTVYPSFNDISMLATLVRVFFYITWLYMMLPMMAADCMPIIHLITMAYKFKTLCHRFEAISEAFKREVKISKTHAISMLKVKFLEGIVIHQKLLILTEEIQRVFGIIMSLQVCESSAVAVLLLLRLALSPHQDLTNAFMTYTFVCSLFILLALNLWNAGELTHQASLLSNAMFYCDWYKCDVNKDSKNIRKLVLIGCAQAQKPLILKAFGVQDLSYATFVSVARMTYSIFAVFYQRRH
ncbi:odorant receptor 4-like [Pieris rapae]|uniref:odorant receptor 4-like n=1 Tax=Pieris rapae TaxID=64459 RepID=UPI001E27F16F|nr:odorant receptor 4-like [Pieris rapae]